MLSQIRRALGLRRSGLLVDWEIEDAIASGEIIIDPISEPDVQIQPCSVDLRIGPSFLVFNTPLFIPGQLQASFAARLGKDLSAHMRKREAISFFTLQPGEFALGATIERVKLSSNYMARIEGRSSVGRAGLFVHVSAGFVDCGYDGHPTLELFNAAPHPIDIPVGHRICQLAITRLNYAARRAYGRARGSKYVGDAARTVSPSLDDRRTA